MASDTVPAAVPEPGTPPGATPDTPPQGGLTGLLAPITPARNDDLPPFDLPAAAGPDSLTDGLAALAGGSSSDFHQSPDTNASSSAGGDKTGGSQQGIWRAWMLALAKRHEQAGAARLKALDIKKARATALQVKEQRTTNRSEKFVGGNTGTNANTQSKADKSNGSKTSTSAGRNDHKDHRTKTAGPAGSSGRGHSAGGSSGRGGGGTGPGSGSKDSGKNKNTGSGTGHGAGKGTGKANKPSGTGGKDGASGRQGGSGTGKPGKDGKDTTSSRSGSNNHRGPKSITDTCGSGSGIDMVKKPKTKPAPTPDSSSGKNGPQPKNNGTTKPQPAPANGGKGEPGKPGANTGPGTPPSGKTIDLKKRPGPKPGPAADAPKTTPKTTPAGQPKTPQSAPGTKPTINTQPSREAGYRDGTRIGKVEAHVGAWRDGVRDGRADIKQAADREKARLDRSHQAATQRRPPTPPKTIPPKPTQPPTVPTRSEDPPMTTTSARPVQVTNVDASHITLGDGAARPSMSRGEVRTLRGFQKRLNGKTDRMTRVAEATRTLEQHANDQVREVAVLRELAHGVKGGERLLATLARLEEAATIQASKAGLIYKRAVRGAEACRVLNANANTRYGGIYKAVVDSPETTPAEMRYYREMTHA